MLFALYNLRGLEGIVKEMEIKAYTTCQVCIDLIEYQFVFHKKGVRSVC
jgi:hypothetical protein